MAYLNIEPTVYAKHMQGLLHITSFLYYLLGFMKVSFNVYFPMHN